MHNILRRKEEHIVHLDSKVSSVDEHGVVCLASFGALAAASFLWRRLYVLVCSS